MGPDLTEEPSAVTALPAGAGSFSSRGGLTRAQPGPGGDVAGPIQVGVQGAVDRADDGVPARPGAAGPAGMAVDRGKSRVHEHDSPSGTFSLGCDVAARVLHGAGGRGGHGGHAEVFEGESVAGVDQRPGGLVVEVAPLVAESAPLFGEGPPQPSAVAGAGPGAGLAALQVGDSLLSGVEEPRVGDDLAVAGGQEPRHAQVDPDRTAGGWQQHGLDVGDNDHIPAAVLPLELQRLHPTNHRSMLPDFDSADRLEAGMGPAATIGRVPPGAVPGDELYLVEALIGFEPRVTDPPDLPFQVASTPEVNSEHGIEAAKGLLLGGEGVATLPKRVGGANGFKLRRLVAVGHLHLLHAPGVTALGESGVVQVTVVGQQPNRPALLRTGGVGAQLVSASHGWKLRREDMPLVKRVRGTIQRLRRRS